MKKISITILITLLPLLASADAVEIDGIYYNLIPKAKKAEVTSNPNKYTGEVHIPDKVTYESVEYSVTSIREMAFQWCSEITSVTIPNSVVSIGEQAFWGCRGLTSITIPNSVTSIGEIAFRECVVLTSITLPNNVSSIGRWTFYECSSLSSISLPTSLASIGESCFFGCSSLTSLNIPNSVTYIGGGAFQNCSGLSSVNLPSSLTSIGNNVFSGCSGLTSIIIPNTITSIGNGAFQNCSGLSVITIGNGVKEIGNNAFTQCTKLTDVYCMVEEITSLNNSGPLYTNINAFDGSYIEYATLHVPESAINDYKATEPWSKFGKFETLSSEELETKKCATPTIIFEDGKVKFSCETEGVEYVSNISTTDTKDYYDAELTLAYKYKVTVYATKEGYENSDTATTEFTATGKFGDLNHDNKVNVADAVIIIDMIMKNEE